MGKILSIIVPSYNMERYLARCCDSLLPANDNWSSLLEVIIVNDGSCDCTSEIAHGYECRYPKVFRVIDKANGNYGSCINVALKEVRGTFVKVVDADDCYERDGLGKLLEFLPSTDADVILTDWLDVTGDDFVRGKGRWKVKRYATISAEEFLKAHPFAVMFGLTYRTSLFGKIGYRQMEGISYTDLEWSNLPLAVARKVAYFPEVVYRYTVSRVGQTSDVATKRRNYWMVLKMFEDLVRQYVNLRTGMSVERRNLMDSRIALKADGIYRQGHVIGARADFLAFDKELFVLSPEIYALSGMVRQGAQRFNFVRNFRSGTISSRLKIFGYCILMRAYSRLRLMRLAYRRCCRRK